jgi:hypothetical protein
VSTKDIRPTDAYTVCDVCGRTLLRGEHAEVFINGGTRRSVCELCKTRALHEGWVREGTIPDYDTSQSGADRRRSLLGRLRRRDGEGREGSSSAPTLDDALAGEWPEPVSEEDAAPRRQTRRESRQTERSARRRAQTPVPDQTAREPRHVRAVPTSEDHKFASAVGMFNRSEHPRTVAGVARSLGAPAVALIPDPVHPTLVRIVVSWELCWYRYEVDLSEQVSSVRLDGQGYELEELDERERVPIAAADDIGQLTLL